MATSVERNFSNDFDTVKGQIRRARVHFALFTLGANVVTAIALFLALRHC